MLVHFVTDQPTKIAAVRAMLEPQYQVVPRLLGEGGAHAVSKGVLMIDADLRQTVRVEQVKHVLRELGGISDKLFVVQGHVRSKVAQAYALGATAVVSRPKEILSKLTELEVASKLEPCGSDGAAAALAESAAAFASMFVAARNGQPLNLGEAEQATSQIVNSISQNGLGEWLDGVRRYHEGTFQHCLLVTGVAVGFALDIGFADPDVRRLGVAATLHDIGKAHIPLSILDKPGQLNAAEEAIMRRHPMIGYDLLKDIPGISLEVLDGVRHHHEYLDGSGYPDGLAAPEISDLVRLLTISDIFAALIEQRSYRQAISRQSAYTILCDMKGKLEPSLVKAFRNVALLG